MTDSGRSEPAEPSAYGPLLDGMDGSGTEADPYVVTDVRELQAIDADLTAHYVLGNDIDAEDTAVWNDGDGFDPIGDSDSKQDQFHGSFDGRGHEIRNLTIDRPNRNAVGLFSVVSGVQIKAVDFVDCRVVGAGGVGGLAGMSSATVEDVSVVGEIEGRGIVGGLIGVNSGTVRDSESSGLVAADLESGGLVGKNRGDGRIEAVTVTADVVLRAEDPSPATNEGNRIGGLVGTNEGVVRASHARGDVDGYISAGGFAGKNTGTITDSAATGATEGESNIGGFVGENHGTRSEIVDSEAEAAVVGDGLSVGGFAGENHGTIADTTATVDIEVESTNTGGFVGDNDGTITGSRTAGTLEGTGDSIGGFAGKNSGDVTGSATDVDVRGEGLTGGGFVGKNEGSIIRCLASGDLLPDWRTAGGLVGKNFGDVRQSLATGEVIGERTIGGLAGTNAGRMTNCLATTKLYGPSSVGALVGRLGSSASESDDLTTVRTSYWDIDVVEKSDAVGTVVSGDGETVVKSVEGFETGMLQGQSASATLSAFDFDGGWQTVSDGYPEPRLLDADADDSTLDPAPDVDDYDKILADATGTGTEDDPYVITSVEELQAIDADLGAHYVLGRDVDASATAGWNDGDGFDPIGAIHPDEQRGFTGTLDGKGNEIVGLEIDHRDRGTGMFAAIDGGTVHDLTLSAVRITGYKLVGGLCGQNTGSLVGTTVDGEVTGTEGVGMLVGANRSDGTFRGVSADGDVSATSIVGGLVGVNSGEIDDATVTITLDADESAGGVAGHNLATIKRADVTVKYSDGSYVGGVAGRNGEEATIRESLTSVDLTGAFRGGGIVGHNQGSIVEVIATGNTSGWSCVGGVVGINVGRIRDTLSRCSVSGQQAIGGLVGINAGLLAESLGVGDTSAQMSVLDNIGGIVGLLNTTETTETTIRNVYYDADSASCDGAIGTDAEAATVESVSGFETNTLCGAAAADYLSGLDFEATWTVSADADEYPRLRALC
ncbi:hypothetical protein [Halogeometricum borinquense]|uniref:hypothetical protein n=1 Tax=Halogeometricum borinquense TaxID=60847 RepID=UPI003413B11D